MNSQNTVDTAVVLKDARARIATHGWSATHEFWPSADISARDAIEDYTWRLSCPASLYGSIKRLNDDGLEMSEPIGDSPLLYSTADAALDVSLMVGQVVQKVFPSRCEDDPPWDAIHTFNSHPLTTEGDVLDVLDAALSWATDGTEPSVHKSEDEIYRILAEAKRDEHLRRRKRSASEHS